LSDLLTYATVPTGTPKSVSNAAAVKAMPNHPRSDHLLTATGTWSADSSIRSASVNPRMANFDALQADCPGKAISPNTLETLAS
jgi:hypothetical protein